MKHNIISFIFLCCLLPVVVLAGEATFSGRIVDDSGAALPYANIYALENNRGTTSNLEGKFRLHIAPGSYTFVVSYIGHETQKLKIALGSNQSFSHKFVLKNMAIRLGEITVVAEDEFIPIEPQTKSVIRSGEIEHIQASSLNDILQLIPGEKTSNPTLQNREEATIRSGSSLGTQIIMDDIPISNNANMQTGIGYASGLSGIDLRAIPAENIQEVEVIRGIPSVQYGDLTDGMMLVRTKSQPDPLRIKFKYNPHLYETNLSGGIQIKDWVLNGNLNTAISERDIRVKGDGYTRFSAQLSAKRETDAVRFKNMLYFTTALDESKEKPGYALREAWYNRDYNLKYSANAHYNFSQLSRVAGNFSVSYTRQNSYLQQLVSRDNLVLSDRIEEGTQEGVIVFGSYLGKKWIKGQVWNFYADVSHKQQFSTSSLYHQLLSGFTWRDDFNKGDGTVFDPLFPPILGTQSIRLRSYNELPSFHSFSLYAEDKITGRFLKPFTLLAGFRYEAYRPTGLNFSGLWSDDRFIKSFNGSFFNPRLNLSYNLFEKTQLRVGFGSTSKSPPMGMIYPGPEYFDIVDTVAVRNPAFPDSNFSIISTYKKDQSNQQLQGYKQNKFEVSLDHQTGPVGISITGFINDTKDMFRSLTNPIILTTRSFPDWPDQLTAFARDTLFESYNGYINDGWQKVRGIELSLKTRRLPVVQTVLSFDASYQHNNTGRKTAILGSQRYSPELGLDVKPYYHPYENYDKNLLLNYRFDIQAKSLGIWITLNIQQLFLEIDGRTGLTDTLAIGYFSDQGNNISIEEEDRDSETYVRLRRSYETHELNEEDPPGLLLFNLKVSKSLWQGAEVSFYVNNFFNYRPFYRNQRSDPNFPTYTRRNPPIFFGVQMSSTLGAL